MKSATQATKTPHPEVTLAEQQLQTLMQLFAQVPINPPAAREKLALQHTVQQLQTSSLCEALRETFDPKDLARQRDYAAKMLQSMGRINRDRFQSLMELSGPEMHHAIYESLFLLDINPHHQGHLELQRAEHRQSEHKSYYYVFPEKAPAGIEGPERYLPRRMRDGNSSLRVYLGMHYPRLVSFYGGEPSKSIRALTTIGSLGGLGHKSNSDIDAQIVIEASEDIHRPWNDLDFFIALLVQVLEAFYESACQRLLSKAEKQQLHEDVVLKLRERYAEGVSAEELRILDLVFPSSYAFERREQLSERFRRDSKAQTELKSLLSRHLIKQMRELPDLLFFLPHLQVFFPSLREKNEVQLRRSYFPYAQGSVFRATRLWKWLADFYFEKLSEEQQKKLNRLNLTHEERIERLLSHLEKSPRKETRLNQFIDDVCQNLASQDRHHLTDMLHTLVERFPLPRLKKRLTAQFAQHLERRVQNNFQDRMSRLVEFLQHWYSLRSEARQEYPMLRKAQQVERYLSHKLPDTEIHFFVNFLRRQRKGDHTPFLVSPEGSQAYSLLLNDFLLNPAIFLAGQPPMPFELPQNLKTLISVGTFPDEDWTFIQTKRPDEVAKRQTPPDQETETFLLRNLPNWGDLTLSREQMLSHAIPIFLRESEKASHGNLPKALLNCLWVEMLVCLDEKIARPTSLTRLLFYPEERALFQERSARKWSPSLLRLEASFPQLIRDPWWLKFSEMLTRFTDEDIQRQLIFCFAQHIKLSDAIDFASGNVLGQDNRETWRIQALAGFYEVFFASSADRLQLMRFVQGRDDTTHKIEKKLKQLFRDSMRRVERKLCQIGHLRGTKHMADHLAQLGDQIDRRAAERFLYPLVALVNQRVVIEDSRVIHKLKKKQPLTAVEKLQAQNIYEDHRKMKLLIDNILEYYKQFELPITAEEIREIIEGAKIKTAGNPLESVIFRHHFERSIELKPYQVPYPIAKSLRTPRLRIRIEFNSESGKWIFSSILSKTELQPAVDEQEGTNTTPMFEDNMVEGMCRCVFSHYLNFKGHLRTVFEKPAAKAGHEEAQVPFNSQDFATLAEEVAAFFPPISMTPRELLENEHYIREVFMIVNVNKYNTISLVVRDNLNEQFVINYEIGDIDVRVPSKLRISADEELSLFLMRLHSPECRQTFMKTLTELGIPISSESPAQFRIWVNIGRFEPPVPRKYFHLYINGIARSLWPADSLVDQYFLTPAPIYLAFDDMGRRAIEESLY